MTDTIEVFVDQGAETRLVGRCHFVARQRGQSSVFEYADAWLERVSAFALDPANLALEHQQIYTSSDKSALPGALRDTAPDRWGQQLIRRAFRKAGEQRSLSEIDYLLAINDQHPCFLARSFAGVGDDVSGTCPHAVWRSDVPVPAFCDEGDVQLVIPEA